MEPDFKIPCASMNVNPLKTRFAPSPTGLLHLGNVRTALFNALMASKHKGTFLLRIEDTDLERSQESYIEALIKDLRWLGLVWQEGPGAENSAMTDVHIASYRQSQRGAVYDTYFSVLENNGQVYPCFCTEQELKLARKTQLAAGRPPRYSGRCHRLDKADVAARVAKGEPASLRFHVANGDEVEFEDGVRGLQKFHTDDIGDFIIRRSDGTPAFFFCNAVDDALMNVTLVLRGEDHLTNTPRQILLLQALNLDIPTYAHMAMVVGADGAPLSKRHGSRSVQEMRESGYFALAINNYLARLGHSYESNAYMSLTELAVNFDMAHLGRAPAHFDSAQLLHWQHEAILHASAVELWQWMGAEVHTLIPADVRDSFIRAVRANISLPEHALLWARVILTDELVLSDSAHAVIRAAGQPFFADALQILEQYKTDFRGLSDELKRVSGKKGKALFQPLRAALTGELDGPEMTHLLPLITQPRARQRLEAVLIISQAPA